MMRARPYSKKLTIEHVRHRRERMPVLRMNVRERPDDVGPTQPASNVRIIQHVEWIVVVDELKSRRLREHGPRDRDQSRANRKFQKQILAHSCVN